jgi:hypothetical protein
MTQQVLDIVDFLKLMLDALKAARVEYLIGGAIAGWAWGEPRATQDVDMVINLPIESIEKFSKELAKRDMLVPAEILLNAILEDRADIPIHAIHMHSGLKADLYPLRQGDELRLSAFQRKQQVDFGPPVGQVYVHSPEDLILYKLLYFSNSQQPKHSRDIAAILLANKEQINFVYIQEWTDRLGLGSLWKELLGSVEE